MVNENIFIYFIRDIVFFGIIVCFYVMCYVFYINVGFTGVLLFIVVCSRRENSKLVYLVGGIKI